MVANALDIPNGYKRTERGVFPEDWKGIKLDDVSNFITKGSTPTTYGHAWQSFGILFLRSECVTGRGLDLRQSKFISAEANRDLARSVIQGGDLLITITGNVGRVVMLPEDFQGGNINQHIARIRINSSDYLPEFIFHQLGRPESLRFFERIVTGQAYPQISLRQVRDTVIEAPNREEQTAIAEALTDTDEAIRSLEAVIAKKRDVKQATLHALLTPTRRLPGFSGDWGKLSLGKCASLKARIGWQGLTTKEYQLEGPCGLITGTDFKDGNIDWSNIVYVEEDRYTQDVNIQVKIDDVLITKDGTIGKVALVKSIPIPTTLNSGVFVIRPKAKAFHPKFLYYILLSEYFEVFLKKLSAGSTINHLYQKDFVDFQFPTPPSIKEQAAIAAILSDMDAEIEGLQARLDKLRDIKQGMMQVLLTGKVRLI